MHRPKATLVFTTIFDPVILETYYANAEKFGHLDDLNAIVVPDRKTPTEAYRRCADISARGLRTSCPTIEEQERFLRGVGLRPGFIPYDSDNRRNVGYLMAYAGESDFLISIDDDNYCGSEEDFFTEHAVVCSAESEQTVVRSATGFLNLCDLLEMDVCSPVYPRGFPYGFRHRPEQAGRERGTVAVHVNAGLWLLDPDVDGMTWLVIHPRVKRFRGESIVLHRDTWSPINSQNTALRRDAIPGYYFLPMGYTLAGTPIDRYGDIFSGYFVQACAKHLGGSIRAGTPVAEHKRNRHNYMKDATQEMACIQILEDLLPWLREARLEGSSYTEAFYSLSDLMEDAVEGFRGPIWAPPTLGYFHEIADDMRVWLKACRQIHG